jgi:UDP-N-acetylmuramoyl-L-alanyl-D-glutamate--2,6-diaminopimelate ligase
MSDSGGTHVILEVSSHALDQGRVNECPFKAAIFTNFSRDHLDYHKTMDEYFRAKSLLFSTLQDEKAGIKSFAIINIDDPKGETLVSLAKGEVVTYGLGKRAQVRADSVSADRRGLRARLITPIGERDIRSSLLGEINIYNILAAVATAISLDVDLDTAIEGVRRLEVVPGRLELVKNTGDLNIVVDYAHTPDALLKALKALRSIVEGKLITVFGCGGDRDKGKRFEMGLISGENSDIVFLTSDNPRTEDPEKIVDQVEEGISKSGMTRMEYSITSELMEKTYFREVDRRKAIRKAISVAGSEDIVLIAGKGHEDYQIVGTEKHHFDDREEAVSASMPVNYS